MKARRISLLLAAFGVTVFLLSCAHTGTISQVGAGVLQSVGVVDARTADAISRTGVAWGAAFEEITPEQEYFIGRAVAANVLSTYRLQTNRPEITTYLNRICYALIINSPRPEIFNGYHVAILDSDEINAFATPGGHIFISRGLISCATSEDTLAAVIAHEIAHIQLQHGLKAIRNNRRTQAILTSLSAGASLTISDRELAEATSVFSESINDIVTSMVTNGYSRTQEQDADTTAMALMALAGYEPSALIDMLRVLERNQPGRPGGFNSTHPTPAQRISNAQRTVGNYNVQDTRSFRQARYTEAMRGL